MDERGSKACAGRECVSAAWKRAGKERAIDVDVASICNHYALSSPWCARWQTWSSVGRCSIERAVERVRLLNIRFVLCCSVQTQIDPELALLRLCITHHM
uniref:Uncharacterized protein n=1 Tax=Erythrolobus australicus TaxID=1077150 RepID=A0A7S1TM65_9RHOD